MDFISIWIKADYLSSGDLSAKSGNQNWFTSRGTEKSRSLSTLLGASSRAPTWLKRVL